MSVCLVHWWRRSLAAREWIGRSAQPGRMTNVPTHSPGAPLVTAGSWRLAVIISIPLSCFMSGGGGRGNGTRFLLFPHLYSLGVFTSIISKCLYVDGRTVQGEELYG